MGACSGEKRGREAHNYFWIKTDNTRLCLLIHQHTHIPGVAQQNLTRQRVYEHRWMCVFAIVHGQGAARFITDELEWKHKNASLAPHRKSLPLRFVSECHTGIAEILRVSAQSAGVNRLLFLLKSLNLGAAVQRSRVEIKKRINFIWRVTVCCLLHFSDKGFSRACGHALFGPHYWHSFIWSAVNPREIQEKWAVYKNSGGKKKKGEATFSRKHCKGGHEGVAWALKHVPHRTISSLLPTQHRSFLLQDGPG